MTREMMKHLLESGKAQAFADGRLEFHSSFGWESLEGKADFDWNNDRYRIKPEKPESKLRPWREDEVPLGAWLRAINKSDVGDFEALLLRERDARYAYASGKGTTFQDCLDNYEHSIDGGKTWKPCGVEE